MEKCGSAAVLTRSCCDGSSPPPLHGIPPACPKIYNAQANSKPQGIAGFAPARGQVCVPNLNDGLSIETLFPQGRPRMTPDESKLPTSKILIADDNVQN